MAAKTPFLPPENAAKWAVLDQWYVYWMESCLEQRHALSQSGATNGSKEPASEPECVAFLDSQGVLL